LSEVFKRFADYLDGVCLGDQVADLVDSPVRYLVTVADERQLERFDPREDLFLLSVAGLAGVL